MTSKSFAKPFEVSLALLLLLFLLMMATPGLRANVGWLTKGLFALTMVIEVAALFKVAAARKLFSRADPLHLAWTLLTAFLIVRLIAQARLASLTFGLVPPYKAGASESLFFYVVILRYLYTVSDLLLVAALASTIRSYKSAGLHFKLLSRDYVYFAVLWAVPLITYVFRANLELGGVITVDKFVVAYRLTAVCVGALIATLCLVVRRYALQMGGGAVARIWNTVVIAGIARALSFLVLALMLKWWRDGAQFGEQLLLWIFAGCWLLAPLYQSELLPLSAARTERGVKPEPELAS